MSVVAISSQTIAIIIVAVLFAQFLLLLGAALVRSRRGAAAGPAGPETAAAPAEPEAKPERKPRPVTRREFFRGSLLASLGLFAAEFGAATVAFVWPNLSGSFGGDVDTGLAPDDIKAQIRQDNQPFYLGAGRFYIVEYDGSGADTVYSGLIDGGLMALFQRCVHLGCRVPFCEQSQWFECPCHGSKYNLAGEYRDGPAPRGLDRFALRVEENTVVVDTSTIVLGPPRGTVTTQPEPDGPFCVTGGLEG